MPQFIKVTTTDELQDQQAKLVEGVRHSGLCSCLRRCAAVRAGVRICAESNFRMETVRCLATTRLCRENRWPEPEEER